MLIANSKEYYIIDYPSTCVTNCFSDMLYKNCSRGFSQRMLYIIKLWLLCFQLLRTDDNHICFYKNDQIGFNNTSYILF